MNSESSPSSALPSRIPCSPTRNALFTFSKKICLNTQAMCAKEIATKTTHSWENAMPFAAYSQANTPLASARYRHGERWQRRTAAVKRALNYYTTNETKWVSGYEEGKTRRQQHDDYLYTSNNKSKNNYKNKQSVVNVGKSTNNKPLSTVIWGSNNNNTRS